ncbi:TetR/AcrR family transcriptional regulator [Nocardia caishijiensis]|uniref:TetR family transcriptional regulator n=1 Tax=Nocardia caishijiensis TaxID=184756 RepID=A0ABQ6YK79_9NOCA|nr:TetR/AcrR family transcriptional regulator [Nocardia caishijiensis]KAF0846192.1 TetR family transcriptional regulator [Nocardia caishijiensis]
MPKQVDHSSRRAEISDAVMRLLARDGLESISLRHVAAEAGVSAGQVQHYFPTKDAMMEFATTTIAGRIQARIAAAGPDPDLRQILTALLPTDAESAADTRTLIGYLAFASVRPPVAETLATNGRAFRDHIAGMLPHHPDPTGAANTLLALLDGLALHVTLGQLPAADARTVLTTAIDEACSRQPHINQP